MAARRARAAALFPGDDPKEAEPPPPTPVALDEVARERYRTYALSVITSRALPDVRDGLKPVQRRILTTMWRQGLKADGRFRKCAKVVGDVMGAYHPHGDSAIYEALVRMAQPFASRLPLIEGAGNFGSLDGDPAAAMRYTECRLAPAANEVLADFAANTVPERPTYDGARTEPVVLPTRLPLLLVNGSTGIAVGVATSIPPHNLLEVVEALLALLDDESLTSRDLAGIVRGPDFPTGGEILDSPAHLAAIYEEGRGSVRVRGTVREAGTRRNIRTLVIESIPYGVNKAQLVQRLGEIAADRTLPQLLEVSDLSTDDVRIQLEVRKDADPDKVLAYLYKRTPLQSNFTIDLTCLRFDRSPGGAPERVGLRTLLLDFLAFRREVVRRRLEDERGKLEARLRVLEGFAIVFDALDRVLALVRASEGKADAAKKIRAELPLDADQTEAILELKIYRLARLEIEVVLGEMEKRRKRLREVEKSLSGEAGITELVRGELVEIRDRYRESGARRTVIGVEPGEVDFAEEDFIVAENADVMLTADGWIRRQREIADRRKLRLREGDRLLRLARGSTRAPLALFSSLGTAFTLRIVNLPATAGYGDPVQKHFALRDNERIVEMASLDERLPAGLGARGKIARKDDEVRTHALAVTRGGYAFRFWLDSHLEPSNRTGRKFARLKKNDEVLGVALTTGAETLIVAARSGRALLCPVEDINLLSGPGLGVKAIALAAGDSVIGFHLARGKTDALTALTPGGGKRLISRNTHEVGTRGRKGTQVLKAGFVEVETGIEKLPDLSGPA